MADFTRLPHALPPQPTHSTQAGLACRIVGDHAPALEIVLDPDQLVLLHADAVLWKEPSVLLLPIEGPLVQAEGPGSCGLAIGRPGMIFPIPLSQGQSVQLRPGHLLVSAGVEILHDHIHGLGDRLAGGQGIAVHRFTAGPGGGVLWVQAEGAVFERGLVAGEPFDIRAEAWLCKDATVSVERIHPQPDPAARFELPCLRFTGPGRVAFQTAFQPDPAAPAPPEPPRRGVAEAPRALRALHALRPG